MDSNARQPRVSSPPTPSLHREAGALPTSPVSTEGAQRSAVVRLGPTGSWRANEWLVVERALQIEINGAPFTTTMRTPGHDRWLVRGLIFSEGVVRASEAPMQIGDTDEDPTGEVDRIAVTIPDGFLDKTILQGARTLVANSSCGICGKREADDFRWDHSSVVRPPNRRLDLERLSRWMDSMREAQPLFGQTGGSHAAAAFDANGVRLAVHEDIGRHNAVDKVLGALLESGWLDRAECLTVSGRLSFEIVEKASRAAIPFLAAVGAPSSLAVGLAQRRGITLVGFCREGRATVYSHAKNIVGAEEI